MDVDRSKALAAFERICNELGIEFVTIDQYKGRIMEKVGRYGMEKRVCKNAQHYGLLVRHGWKEKK